MLRNIPCAITLVLIAAVFPGRAVREADLMSFGRHSGDAALFRNGAIKMSDRVISFSCPFFGEMYVVVVQYFRQQGWAAVLQRVQRRIDAPRAMQHFPWLLQNAFEFMAQIIAQLLFARV